MHALQAATRGTGSGMKTRRRLLPSWLHLLRLDEGGGEVGETISQLFLRFVFCLTVDFSLPSSSFLLLPHLLQPLPLLPAPSSSPLSLLLLLRLLSPFSLVMELLTHCSRLSAGRSLALIPLIPPQISSLHIHLTAAGRHRRDLCDAVIIHLLLPAVAAL